MPETTELRLDYKDLSAGQLVIVIQGLPVDGDGPFTVSAGDARIAVAAGPDADRARSASSPLVEEAHAVRDEAAYPRGLATPLLLAAWRGRESLAAELAAATIEEAPAAEAARAAALADYARAVLSNGLGRYADAVEAARRASAADAPSLAGRACVELVEAAARSDARADAAGALRRLEEDAGSGADRPVGIWARSAALLGGRAAAETLYREAIERLDADGAAIHLARTRLVYGEWLRREGRRVDAREQLRAAHETLDGIGAAAFAERARRELVATGETARRRVDATRGDLTPQEAQIALLAREGFSNPEIGTQLFISHRTVQYHLRKVFAKLEISSRNQLGRLPASALQAP